MSRVRRFNLEVLGIQTPDHILSSLTRRLNRTGDRQLKEEIKDWDLTPLDSEEQEELINKFEVSNYSINHSIINFLTALYLLLSGFFLIMGTKTDHAISCVLLTGIQSILCSCITLRYNLTNDFIITRKVKYRINNSTINTINSVILVLIEWVSVNHLEGQRIWQLILQLPLLLFIVTILIKKWNRDMEKELDELRQLKYKYKNV